jgi:hypothetical protein
MVKMAALDDLAERAKAVSAATTVPTIYLTALVEAGTAVPVVPANPESRERPAGQAVPAASLF